MATGDSGVGCIETIQRLYSFLDGELTEDRRQEIQRHLDDCPPCVEVYGFEAELRVVVASRCRERVPESLVKRVRTALEAEAARLSGGPTEP